MKRLRLALVAGALSIMPIPAIAQTPPKATVLPAKPLDLRIEQLPAMLAGTMKYEDYFSRGFLAAVPAAEVKALSDQFITQYGKPLKVIAVEPSGPNGANIKIEYERAIATAEITVESTAPNKVVGLLVKGFELKGDTPARIDADFAALPGKAGYLTEKSGADGRRQQIAGRATGQQFAIASTFKLYILAELASQVQAGRRSWSDVVPILDNSYSSSATQNWPRSTPATLQTLATWMISVSDNAATDALMRVLGRDAVERKLATIGHSDPDKALPMLTTVEVFSLKSNPGLRTRFEKATEPQQRELLDKEAKALKFESIDVSKLGSGPVAIDSIEWFASPADIANLLNNIRRTGNQTALDIMAVNKGVSPASAAKWKFLGYKGGSEPGVISMSFLAQSKAGDWYTISGSWNDPTKEVDNAKFTALMARLLDSAAG
ncbi:MAG: serine hydrolase [Sphingomonadaceae bacterium]|nr:serine hydrolase [Sphingomonadaceae bacterium]